MSTTTPNLGLIVPTVNVDTGWGGMLNQDLDTLDAIFAPDGTGTGVGINVGGTKTMSLKGTMIIGTGDGTDNTGVATIRGADVASGTTNVLGCNVVISAGNGTGNKGSGSFIVRTAPSAVSSGYPNTMENALVVNNNQDTGFGTSTPEARVHSYKSTNSLSVMNVLQNKNAGAFTGGVIAFVNSETNLSGDRYAYIGARTTGASQTGNNLVFGTNPTGGSATERFRITSLGEFGIGGANYGTAGQSLVSNGSGAAPSWSNPPVLNAFNGENLTGQSAVTFPGMPSSYVKSIQMVILKVKVPANVDILFRCGGASIDTTGYTAYSNSISSSGTSTSKTATNGFIIPLNSSGATEISGTITLQRVYSTAWVCSYSLVDTSSGAKRYLSGGGYNFVTDLSQVQITPSTGSFDATAGGNARVFYQI